MNPGDLLGWFLEAWLTALAACIGYRILTGAISLNGLLTMDGSRFSPERLQLLLVTGSLLAYYVTAAINSKSMPSVPTEWLALLAASHGVYLGGKTAGR